MTSNKIKNVFAIIFLMVFLVSAIHAQEIVPLYAPGNIPNAKGSVDMPTMTAWLPVKHNRKTPAVIVCAGGAYGARMDSYEGDDPAKKLAAAGIASFVLHYRLPDANEMLNKETGPLTDAQRAIQLLREHAGEYQVDPRKIGIMGFSAGGHLASTAGTHYQAPCIANPKGTRLRPDFMVLAYPVISFADSLTHEGTRYRLIGPDINSEKVKLYSNELQVTDDTPPAYLVHAIDDDGVRIENALYFDAALRQHHIPMETFIYAKGGHGFGIDNTTAPVQWIDDCIQWIKKGDWKISQQKSNADNKNKIVVLSFDDAIKTHYTIVAPLLKKYGFNATFFVCEIPDFFGDTTKYMSWTNMQQLSRMGFDIGNHTGHHRGVSELTKKELEDEIVFIEKKCDSFGIPRPTSFAYPGYGTSEEALPVLKEKGYVFARTGGEKTYDPGKDDPLLMPSFTPNDNLQSAIAAIEQADSGIVVLTIHGVPDNVHPWVNTSVETFEAYLKYLKGHQYTVMSMRQLAKHLHLLKKRK